MSQARQIIDEAINQAEDGSPDMILKFRSDGGIDCEVRDHGQTYIPLCKMKIITVNHRELW